MKSKKRTCALVTILIITLLLPIAKIDVFAVSQETKEAINKAEEEKEELEQELINQEQEKNELQNKKQKEEQNLEQLRKQYQNLTTEITDLEEKVEKKEKEIAEKEKELEKAIEKQNQQYDDMKKRIQFMYEKVQGTVFEVVLGKSSMSDILNKIDYTVKLREYDKDKMEEYVEITNAVNLQKEELEAAKAELEGLVAQTKSKQAKVSDLQKKTGESINAYLNQIAEKETNMEDTADALELKSKKLKELYAKAEAEEAAERKRKAEEAARELLEKLQNGTIGPMDSGITYGPLNFTQREIDMLTAMIYCESRGEPYEGQLAVGYVITNRVRSSKFPNDLESVLRAHRQFEPAGSGKFDIVLTAYWEQIPGVISETSWASCQRAAIECLTGESNVGESLFFRTHAPVPQLAENLEAAGVPYWIIKNHIFYYSWVSY